MNVNTKINYSVTNKLYNIYKSYKYLGKNQSILGDNRDHYFYVIGIKVQLIK